MRREQLLLARQRRNELIEEQLANPRHRKAVTQRISEDARSRFRRASAAFFRMAERES